MKALVFYFVFATLLFVTCKPPVKEPKDANEAYYESIKNLTGLEFDERLKGADSLVFFFYDNPDGDAKRYTRYYTELSTQDSSTIVFITQATNKQFIRLERIKECRSQGKIFMFENSKPKQTLYYSNRGDTCNHLYFIKDGWFYYMPMDTTTANLLNTLKPLAKKPSGDSGQSE